MVLLVCYRGPIQDAMVRDEQSIVLWGECFYAIRTVNSVLFDVLLIMAQVLWAARRLGAFYTGGLFICSADAEYFSSQMRDNRTKHLDCHAEKMTSILQTR